MFISSLVSVFVLFVKTIISQAYDTDKFAHHTSRTIYPSSDLMVSAINSLLARMARMALLVIILILGGVRGT